MKALVSAVLIVLAVIIAVKLVGLALKAIGILIVCALAVVAYVYAQRLLKGPDRA